MITTRKGVEGDDEETLIVASMSLGDDQSEIIQSVHSHSLKMNLQENVESEGVLRHQFSIQKGEIFQDGFEMGMKSVKNEDNTILPNLFFESGNGKKEKSIMIEERDSMEIEKEIERFKKLKHRKLIELEEEEIFKFKFEYVEKNNEKICGEEDKFIMTTKRRKYSQDYHQDNDNVAEEQPCSKKRRIVQSAKGSFRYEETEDTIMQTEDTDNSSDIIRGYSAKHVKLNTTSENDDQEENLENENNINDPDEKNEQTEDTSLSIILYRFCEKKMDFNLIINHTQLVNNGRAWRPSEIVILLEGMLKYGREWTKILSEFKNKFAYKRSKESLRNKWRAVKCSFNEDEQYLFEYGKGETFFKEYITKLSTILQIPQNVNSSKWYKPINIGDKIGRLEVVEKTNLKEGNNRLYICKCNCQLQTVFYIQGCSLNRRNPTRSCGCLRKEILFRKKFIPEIGKRHGKLVVIDEEYTVGEQHRHVVCKCDCGTEEVSVDLSHLRSGVKLDCGCERQNSNGEKRIAQLFNEEGIAFKEQVSFDSLKSLRHCPLRFDFLVHHSDGSFHLIEYDGRQHFEPIDFFGGVKTFLRQQENDKRKNEWCQKHNIRLVRIKYDEKIELKKLL